jgi:hypothetical protein
MFCVFVILFILLMNMLALHIAYNRYQDSLPAQERREWAQGRGFVRKAPSSLTMSRLRDRAISCLGWVLPVR